MKDLIKIGVGFALVFASTFVVMRVLGILQEDQVRAFITSLSTTPPWTIALVVVLLLWLDLLVAVPTMTTILLAGYFLGAWFGAAASIAGLCLMGGTAYGLGRFLGRPFVMKIVGSAARLDDIEKSFARYDLLVLFVCQALPILPEVSCSLAGLSRMNPLRFAFGYVVGVVPFAVIVAYAGSVSSLSNPKPAIFTAIGVSMGSLLCWRVLRNRRAP
jgi:uncharacterized membrane protein YdjX (TVP38/TMEM64 family)